MTAVALTVVTFVESLRTIGHDAALGNSNSHITVGKSERVDIIVWEGFKIPMCARRRISAGHSERIWYL